MIKGKLVGLRALEREDLSLLRDWRNIEEFRRNFREFRELNMEMQEQWFQKVVVDSKNDQMFMVVRLTDNIPLGVTGLVYINWVIRSADLSLYIGHQQKYIDDEGYAEEAARLTIDYGFKSLNLHKVWTELYEFDQKKIEFFEKKLKFHLDGTLRDNSFKDGKYWNSRIYSMIRST